VSAGAPLPDRPRPEYGEYATPEEQRARIQQPIFPDPVPVEPVPEPVEAAPAARAVRPRLFDRVATLVLLAYGLVTVVTSIPSLVDYGTYAGDLLAAMGVEAQLSDPAAGRGYGVAAVIVMAVLWLVAALLSWISIRSGRLSFWIPLVAGAVANLVAGALMVIPLVSDPGVWSAVTQRFTNPS
jgi:hypothetical protein